jgi:hypothetical protein
MFLLNGNRLQEGTGFTDKDGNQYPSNWLNLSTEEEKLEIGITWIADPVRADDRFYWDGNLDNPKALEDVTETVEGKEYITKGLKSNFIAQIKNTAGTMLAQSDWYVIRKLERSVDIPEEVATNRATIIAESNRLEDAITKSKTVEELINVLNNQKWGN